MAAHDTAYIYRRIWRHYTVFVCEEVRSVVLLCGGFVFLFLNCNLHDKPKPCISATSFHLQLVITSQSVKTVSA